MNTVKKYKLKFELDYGCDCLWSADDETEKKFGYHIENLSDVGLSETTIGLSEYVSDLYYFRLNPIYQMLPSFWSGEMHLFFQTKVIELYKKVVADIGSKFEISVSESANREMDEKIDIAKINNDLKIFVDNPVEYFIRNNIHFTDKQSLLDEVKREYENWTIKEQKYLK
ncbi:hypothetical protein ACYULU_12740 [Breznakiellaceae bacterium SP9]